MALNDLHFSMHRRAPWGAALLLVAAAAFVAIAVAAGEVNPGIFAVLPAMIGVMLLAFRPAEVEGTVTVEGIELVRPPMQIPFESIREIEADFDPDEPLPDSFRLRIHHPRGVLNIPEAPDINSLGIYEALMARFGPSGSRSVNSVLSDYVAQHEATFGSERVWTFHADSTRKPGVDIHRPRTRDAITLAVALTAIVWLILHPIISDAQRPNSPWGSLALCLLFLSAFSAFLSWARRHTSGTGGIKKWQTSSVAITPVGLAMIQGDIQGELAWDQLRDVKYRSKARLFAHHEGNLLGTTTTNLRGIVLIVEGARIVIADIYDRPLDLIHDRILRYWAPDRLEVTDEDDEDDGVADNDTDIL
jgi:hypothetical protein